MNKRQAALAWLDEAGVEYTCVEHPAAYDMEDIKKYGVNRQGHVCKNLFLRDSKKGKRHFLLVVDGERTVDLQRAGQALGQRLSFASEQRLSKYLNLAKGEVTPLAVLFDTGHEVEVYFDTALADKGTIGVHPCENTAMVFLRFDDLYRLVSSSGNKCGMIDL